MHLIKNINQVLDFARKFQTRHLIYRTVLGRSGEGQYNTYMCNAIK